MVFSPEINVFFNDGNCFAKQNAQMSQQVKSQTLKKEQGTQTWNLWKIEESLKSSRFKVIVLISILGYVSCSSVTLQT